MLTNVVRNYEFHPVIELGENYVYVGLLVITVVLAYIILIWVSFRYLSA